WLLHWRAYKVRSPQPQLLLIMTISVSGHRTARPRGGGLGHRGKPGEAHTPHQERRHPPPRPGTSAPASQREQPRQGPRALCPRPRPSRFSQGESSTRQESQSHGGCCVPPARCGGVLSCTVLVFTTSSAAGTRFSRNRI